MNCDICCKKISSPNRKYCDKCKKTLCKSPYKSIGHKNARATSDLLNTSPWGVSGTRKGLD